MDDKRAVIRAAGFVGSGRKSLARQSPPPSLGRHRPRRDPQQDPSGDRGVDGRIFPVGTKPSADGLFSEDWFTIQVKQMDKAGRPDIDAFQAVMEREGEGGDSAVSSSVSGILKTPSRNALHFTSEGVESSSS